MSSPLVANPASPPRRLVQAFLASFRLGWAVNSNWTRPSLFLIYSVVRPLSSALVLVFMYQAITGSSIAT